MSYERERSFSRSRRDQMESGNEEEVNKYNRLFIMGAKGATEQEFKEVFGEYGTVETVKCVTDRNSGESRGRTRSKLPIKLSVGNLELPITLREIPRVFQ